DCQQHADRQEEYDALDPKESSALEDVHGPHHVDVQRRRGVFEQENWVHDPAKVYDLAGLPVPDDLQEPRPVVDRGVLDRDRGRVVAQDEFHLRRQTPDVSQADSAPAIEEGTGHMAADESGAAGDENGPVRGAHVGSSSAMLGWLVLSAALALIP